MTRDLRNFLLLTLAFYSCPCCSSALQDNCISEPITCRNPAEHLPLFWQISRNPTGLSRSPKPSEGLVIGVHNLICANLPAGKRVCVNLATPSSPPAGGSVVEKDNNLVIRKVRSSRDREQVLGAGENIEYRLTINDLGCRVGGLLPLALLVRRWALGVRCSALTLLLKIRGDQQNLRLLC
jgi:hypothetical protein